MFVDDFVLSAIFVNLYLKMSCERKCPIFNEIFDEICRCLKIIGVLTDLELDVRNVG